MAEIRLSTPLIEQSNSMSCWYASGLMVTGFPILPLMSDVYTDNLGASPAVIERLASIMGMNKLASATHEFSAHSMIATLSRYGAIYAPGHYSGYGHVIVITGANDSGDGTVFYNDPEHGGSRGDYTIPFFNEKRARGLLFVKD